MKRDEMTIGEGEAWLEGWWKGWRDGRDGAKAKLAEMAAALRGRGCPVEAGALETAADGLDHIRPPSTRAG